MLLLLLVLLPFCRRSWGATAPVLSFGSSSRHTHRRRPAKGRGSFGCSVNLPLGSRSVDPHSTAVWCGNLLHSSPQSHTADCVCHSSFGGVLATTTKICSGGRSSREQSQHDQQSPMPFLHNDALPWLPHRWQTVRERFTDLGTIHFGSCALRQVSCYTFLSGFQPSWPPTCYP